MEVQNTDVELVDIKGVAHMLGGVNHATIYRGITAGVYPKPIKIGQLSRWVKAEWVAVIQSRIDERDAAFHKASETMIARMSRGSGT